MTTHTRYRTPILVAAAAVLALLLHGGTTYTPTAGAHVPPCQSIAVTRALADPRPATPAVVAEYRRACNLVAARHAKVHRIATATRRCVRAAGTMAVRTCRGLAQAAVERNRDAWAWSPALHRLLGKESTWNPNAVNDSSDACGMFQRLVKRSQAHPRGGRGCPWAFTVTGWQGKRRIEVVHASALVQSRDGLRYIADRVGYGSPERALAFHLANGWY